MDFFRFGIKMTAGFFIVGTMIFIWFATTLSARVALFAYEFTITAILINWLYAAILLFNLLKRKLLLHNLFKTLGVMILNIPVGILYSYLMVALLDYARITIINRSNETIKKINVEGCEQKEIDSLSSGDSKTLWIKIPKPCQVTVDYELNSEIKREILKEVFIPGKGINIDFELGQ